MVGHDDEGVESHMGKMGGQIAPGVVDGFAFARQAHLVIFNGSEDAETAACANRHEIASWSGVHAFRPAAGTPGVRPAVSHVVECGGQGFRLPIRVNLYARGRVWVFVDAGKPASYVPGLRICGCGQARILRRASGRPGSEKQL